jgi:16S rRNA (cytidine1402-2'-O)-methyltransferase
MVADRSGALYVVATPIGHLDDITRRALAVLAEVALIAAEDTRHTGRLLAHYGIATPMWSCHEHNEREVLPRLLARLEAGDDVALVSDAGTPLLSDPGFPLVRACRQRGIRVVPVPGASALLAALSVAGLPTDRFCFEGFLPRKQAARRDRLLGLTGVTTTLAFYESSHRIQETLQDLLAVFGPAREAVLARELTKLHETVLAGPLGELQAELERDPQQRKGEFVLLLAGAAEHRAAASAVDEVLRVLLTELPLKQASGLAARLTGRKRNEVYQRALTLQRDPG